MKFTATHEAAYLFFHNIVLQYYRGRLTYKEMRKGIFKAVAQHRYCDAWLDIADIAMHARSVADYEAHINAYQYETAI